jgi:tetratricopeptide (TPR) repeat protein
MTSPAISHSISDLWHLAIQAFQDRDFDQALSYARQTDASADLLGLRGDILLANGLHIEALAAFDQALALKPDSAWLLAHRGEVHYQLNNIEQALDDFNQSLKIKPSSLWALAHRGNALHRKGNHRDALKDFEIVLAKKPDYDWVLILRARVFVHYGRFEEALADMDRLSEQGIEMVPGFEGERSLVLNALGRYEESERICMTPFMEKDDTVAGYSLIAARATRTGLVSVLPLIEHVENIWQQRPDISGSDLLYRQAGFAALKGDQETAYRLLARSVKMDDEPAGIAAHDPVWNAYRQDPEFLNIIGLPPISPSEKPDSSKSGLFQKADSLFRKTAYQEAIPIFDELIETEPSHWAFAHRAEAHRMLGNLTQAKNDFNRALEMKPDYAWALAHRGAYYRDVRDWAAAEADFTRALEISPTYVWALGYRCFIREQLGLYDIALEDFERCLELDITLFPGWRAEKAMLLGLCGRFVEATTAAEDAVANNESDAFSWYVLAVMDYLNTGKANPSSIARAEELYKPLVKIEGPKSYFAHYRLAGLSQIKNDSDLAFKHLEYALSGNVFVREAFGHAPVWRPFHSNPRVQELLQTYKP